MYRSLKEILALLELCIDYYFEFYKENLTKDKKLILDKLREWRVNYSYLKEGDSCETAEFLTETRRNFHFIVGTTPFRSY